VCHLLLPLTRPPTTTSSPTTTITIIVTTTTTTTSAAATTTTRYHHNHHQYDRAWAVHCILVLCAQPRFVARPHTRTHTHTHTHTHMHTHKHARTQAQAHALICARHHQTTLSRDGDDSRGTQLSPHSSSIHSVAHTHPSLRCAGVVGTGSLDLAIEC
jgi:hypothetical protein